MTDDSWRSAICEACWLSREPYTVRIDETGLVEIRTPVRARLYEEGDRLELQVCGYCGAPTIWGVYVRVDPATIPYPTPTGPEPDLVETLEQIGFKVIVVDDESEWPGLEEHTDLP